LCIVFIRYWSNERITWLIDIHLRWVGFLWPSYGLIAHDGDDVFLQQFRAKDLPDACVRPTPVELARRHFSSFEMLLWYFLQVSAVLQDFASYERFKYHVSIYAGEGCVWLVLRKAIAGLKHERKRRLKCSLLAFFLCFRAFFLLPFNPSFEI